MTPYLQDPDFTLYVGSALDVLRELPSHLCGDGCSAVVSAIFVRVTRLTTYEDALHERHPYTADDMTREAYGFHMALRATYRDSRAPLPRAVVPPEFQPVSDRVDALLVRILGGIPRARKVTT